MAIPSAPQNLTVAFEGARAATEGLLRWSPPVNWGLNSLEAYEVSVAEGGVPYQQVAVTFDSGQVSVAGDLPAASAYRWMAAHANTPGLERVDLDFGGQAIKVVEGGGTGDLQIGVNISAQSAGAVGQLYYKDGSAPTSNTDGTIIPWTTGPNWQGNAYTASWTSGETQDADEGRYYWIRPGSATNITSGWARVQYAYDRQVVNWTAPWTDTGSLRTRYLVIGLTRGTEYTFAVRAKNADGVGPASNLVTGRTPICSLHNTLFFKDCVNYLQGDTQRATVHGAVTPVPEVNDNSYNTYSDQQDIALNIAVNGQPTRVDAIFLMCENVDSYALTPTGGQGTGVANRVIPQTVTRWEGTEQSIVMNGIQHELYLIPDGHFTATSVRLQLTGTGVRLYEVMLLEFGLEIDANGQWTSILPRSTDRQAIIHQDPEGGVQRVELSPDNRERWRVDLTAKFVPGRTLLEEAEVFRQFRMRNYNHVFVQEYTRDPWYVYPACFLKKDLPVVPRGKQKALGDAITMEIGER